MLAPRIDAHVNTFDGKEVSLGIDEAGRGCVLGAMVYACFYCSEDGEKVLKELKVDDSKKLTEEQREAHFETFEKLKANFGWRIHAISPQEISARMLQRPKISLNEISHNTAESLIRETCRAGVNVKKAFVDTVGSAATYQAHLQKLFPSIKITNVFVSMPASFAPTEVIRPSSASQVREKADSLFPVVSAASILAKVTRDRRLKEWSVFQPPSSDTGSSAASEAECPSPAFGSGYPGDQVTIEFLHSSMDKVFGFPSVVRWSWETAKNIFSKDGTPVDWFDEVEDKSTKSASKAGAKVAPQQPTKQSRITSFFQSKPQGAPCIERPPLLIKHRIDLITAASNI